MIGLIGLRAHERCNATITPLSLLTQIRMDQCDCGPHTTCKPGEGGTCSGCGKACPTNMSKIEGMEEEK